MTSHIYAAGTEAGDGAECKTRWSSVPALTCERFCAVLDVSRHPRLTRIAGGVTAPKVTHNSGVVERAGCGGQRAGRAAEQKQHNLNVQQDTDDSRYCRIVLVVVCERSAVWCGCTSRCVMQHRSTPRHSCCLATSCFHLQLAPSDVAAGCYSQSISACSIRGVMQSPPACTLTYHLTHTLTHAQLAPTATILPSHCTPPHHRHHVQPHRCRLGS